MILCRDTRFLFLGARLLQKVSVRTCQLTLTTRHVQYVKKSTCAAGAARTDVLYMEDAEFQVGYHMFI